MSPKKRKRDPSPEARLEIAHSASSRIGPVLAIFPALQAPSTTAFKCYSQKRPKNSQTEDEGEDMLVAGESSSIEFVSSEEESRKVADSGCLYLLALRNKKNGAISIYPSAKSPYVLTHTVKALKSIPSLSAPSKVEYLEAKTALGETFGTKKQKENIRAQERNKIDPNAMLGVMDYVMDSIDKGVENLPTLEESQESTNKSRLIPSFSADATDPADVYPLHNIIPEAEWKAIPVSSLETAKTHQERVQLLPYRKSKWIHDHLKLLAQKENKKNFKILFYISAMFALRQALHPKPVEKERLYERFASIPGIIIDNMLSRFSETPRNSSTYQATSSSKTILLTHLFALCLKLDNYATDTKVLSQDLSMPLTDVNKLFKSLGCKIAKLGERERARLGLADSTADDKRAVLNVPVEFPKPRLKISTRK